MKNIAKLLSFAVICGATTLAHVPAKADFYFTDNDRVILRRAVVRPAENVTVFSPGTVIPETVTYEELPMEVTRQLSPAPDGDLYVSYGGNVYLIDHDRRVVDTIDLR